METKTEEVTEKKKGMFWKDAADMFEAVLISVFFVIMLFAYVLRPVTVEGQSMESTLQNQDKLFMTDLLYTPKRGDIVIVDNDVSHIYDENGNLVKGLGLSTATTEKRLIKRIIAVGGETLDIDFTTGIVTIDGEVLEESYINNLTVNDEGAFTYPLTIPEGYYFVMGDNRQHSSDSRHPMVGLVSEEQIMGKAVFRFAPISNFGSIYD
ncbi:MAG: signal peptidase I [Oscillospiraceae bacterium]|nr:signal peptidase I [Oscillospiraceae bacterium]